MAQTQFPAPDLLQEADPDAIGGIVAQWADAWNRHDADALADLVTDDVDFITVAGRWLRGRVEFVEWHRTIHQGNLRRSCWTNLANRRRRLLDDLFLVHLEWAITNETDADGRPRPARAGVFTWLVACRNDAWRIVAAQNTNLADGTTHRLSTTNRATHSIGGRT